VRKKLRLLVLSNGSVYHTQRWVDYFADRGDEVHVASLEANLPMRATTHSLPVLAPVKAMSYPMSLPWVRKLADRIEPDVVVGHFVPSYGFMGALLGRHPLVSVVWGSDILINPGRSRFHVWRARYSLERADLVLSDAAVLTDRIAEMGIQPKRIETFTFGIDTSRFRPLDGDRAEPATILCYRQLLPLYHVDLLVRAVPELLRLTQTPFHVRIIGEGSEKERLIALAASLGVSRHVTFVGGGLSDEALIEEIRRSSIYVSTSRSDTTSVSLLEAMACGVAPVVTDIEGNREWISHEQNGILVPVEQPEKLADGIGRLLDDPALRSRFAERNLRLVRARGDWAKNMERARRLLVELVPGRPG